VLSHGVGRWNILIPRTRAGPASQLIPRILRNAKVRCRATRARNRSLSFNQMISNSVAIFVAACLFIRVNLSSYTLQFWRRRQHVTPNCRYPLRRQYGVAAQNITSCIITTVNTSKLIWWIVCLCVITRSVGARCWPSHFRYNTLNTACNWGVTT
jgi:hypothetical protein